MYAAVKRQRQDKGRDDCCYSKTAECKADDKHGILLSFVRVKGIRLPINNIGLTLRFYTII